MKETREIMNRPAESGEPIERPFDPTFAAANGRYPAYREFNSQDSFQLVDYWNAVRKRLWLVLGIVLLMTTLTAIYISRKPNIYQAKAVIQVDLEQANPDLVTSDRRLPTTADPSYFNTQLQLLTSESLLRRVIKEHNLDSNKDFQQTKSDNSISTWRSMLKAVGLASDDKPKENKTIGEVSAGNTTTVASSEEVAEAIRLAPYVDIIQKNITVDPVREGRATFKETRLIEVSYKNSDPDLAAFVVNSIVESFTKANQEKRSGTNRKTNDFLDKRVSDLQTQIKTDENKLVELNNRAGIIKTDGEQTIVVDRLSGLNKQLLEAENQRKNAEAQYLSVNNSPDSMKSVVEEQMARYISERENYIQTTTNEAQKKIADLKAQKAKLLEEYQESADVVKEVDKQITSLQTSIDSTVSKNQDDLQDYRKRTSKVLLDNLKTKYLQAKDAEDKIKAAFEAQYNQAQSQDQAAVNIKLLQQNIETNKGFLKNLQNNQSENDVIALGTDNNISVAEIAIPPTAAISPRRLTTVAGAFFLSMLFGIGLALFLEYLDDSIRTTEEIENYLQLPALAAIPTIDTMPKRRLLLVGANADGGGGRSDLLINSEKNSSLAEAYRQLRTSILLSTAGHAPKSLLITSSLPSEGKTTTAINTAISLAQTGANVLIIDADMRRPRLHTVFEISNAQGLSNLLASDFDTEMLEESIQTDPQTKLNMITSGPIPPNPAELIGSEQMVNLLKTLQQKYTHVVIDSPPIASFTDGVLIASMVDGVLLVVHANKSSKQIVRRSKQLLSDVGAKIFGVVLNNINLNSQNNYYYYQSYYYRNNYSQDKEK